jgi:prepilin-type processing-associated H-X9-DG protein
MRQLGLACHNAHDTNQKMPPGVGGYTHPFSLSDPNPSSFATVFMFLLPYVEQDNLYKTAFNDPAAGIAGLFPNYNGAYKQAVKTYICPSDPSVDSSGTVDLSTVITDTPGPWGACSYAANAQVFCTMQTDAPYFNPDGTTNSQYGKYENSQYYAEIPRSFPDGTSNTILFAEKYARCVLGDGSTNSKNGGSLWAYWNVLGGGPPHFGPFHAGFATWYFDNGAQSTGQNSKFKLQPNPYLGNCDPLFASTGHSGGMNVTLADGSVRSLSAGISGVTWWEAVTPSDGHVLGSDW